jgi:hypothetical protein
MFMAGSCLRCPVTKEQRIAGLVLPIRNLLLLLPQGNLSEGIFMDALFLFAEARPRHSAVETWLQSQPGELGVLAQLWFEAIRRCGRDVQELMHDECPTACVGDAAFAYVNVYSRHASVGFFRGAELPDPHGLLEGKGKYLRHVKLREDTEINGAALLQLIDAAYRDMRQRVAN